VGGIVFVTIVLLGTVGPFFSPYDPIAMDVAHKLLPPLIAHPLGTDDFGRDVLTRLLYGARVTLFVGCVATAVAMIIGLVLGTVAGYCGGAIDNWIMRVIDIMLGFPLVLLAIMIVVILGPGVLNVIIAVSVSQVPVFARLSRSLTLSVCAQEFVQAAICVGASNRRILCAHIFPNIIAPIVVQATSVVAIAMLNATALNFLGLGIQPPSPDWGAMVSDFRRFIFDRPELPLYPGLALFITILSLNLLGDGLIELVDPTARRNIR